MAPLDDGSFGDGVSCMQASTVTLTRARVVGSARAGIASFGSSVTLGDSAVGCDAFDLDGEPDVDGTGAASFALEGAACGCDASEPCQVLHSTLAAPSAL